MKQSLLLFRFACLQPLLKSSALSLVYLSGLYYSLSVPLLCFRLPFRVVLTLSSSEHISSFQQFFLIE